MHQTGISLTRRWIDRFQLVQQTTTDRNLRSVSAAIPWRKCSESCECSIDLMLDSDGLKGWVQKLARTKKFLSVDEMTQSTRPTVAAKCMNAVV